MMKVKGATNLRWSNAAQTEIDMDVNFDGIGVVPFTASSDDVEPHGAALFADAVEGKYGAVAAYAPPAMSPAQIIADLTNAVQAHLDATARTRNYDGILSLCSYAASTSPQFGPEGLAGVAWRDAVWEACYAILADVQAGQRAVPTANELLAELPPMVWPA